MNYSLTTDLVEQSFKDICYFLNLNNCKPLESMTECCVLSLLLKEQCKTDQFRSSRLFINRNLVFTNGAYWKSICCTEPCTTLTQQAKQSLMLALGSASYCWNWASTSLSEFVSSRGQHLWRVRDKGGSLFVSICCFLLLVSEFNSMSLISFYFLSA